VHPVRHGARIRLTLLLLCHHIWCEDRTDLTHRCAGVTFIAHKGSAAVHHLQFRICRTEPAFLICDGNSPIEIHCPKL
jgi:hypothetical protein